MAEFVKTVLRNLRQDGTGCEKSIAVNLSAAAEEFDEFEAQTPAKVGVRSDGAVVVKPVPLEDVPLTEEDQSDD